MAFGGGEGVRYPPPVSGGLKLNNSTCGVEKKKSGTPVPTHFYPRPSTPAPSPPITQIQGQNAESSSHLPATVRAWDFYLAKSSTFASFVNSSWRIHLCCIAHKTTKKLWMFSPKYDRNRGLVKSIPIQDVVQYDSSTPAVERCVVSVGGTVWVDKLRVIYYSRQTPKLSSSRLQSLTWKHAFTILHQPHTVEKSRSCTTNTPTCPLKNTSF